MNLLYVILFFNDNYIEDMDNLAKHILTPLMEGKSFESDNWKVHDNVFSVHEI